MKKILLIPTYYYLSNPMYIAIKELLKDENFKFTYFYTKDNILVKENLKNISKEKIKSHFDEYEELEYNPIWIRDFDYRTKKNLPFFKLKLAQVKNIFQLIYEYKIYEKELVEKIKSILPDYVILTSDMSISYRVVKKNFPHLKIIIIQPCFLDIRDKKMTKKYFFKKSINIFSGGIMYPSQLYFGLESKKDPLLIFDKNILPFYQKKRNNVFKIINPVFHKLNNDVLKFKSIDIRKKLLKKIKINTKNKIVIIFLSDYSLGHGKKVNDNIKKIYIDIIKLFSSRVNFLIKNHPRIPLIDFENNFEGLSNIHFLCNELSYVELLSIGDLNISHNSNASLEAIVTGMPTLNLVPNDLSEEDIKQSKMLSLNGAKEVSTVLEISEYLESKLLNNGKINSIPNQEKLIGRENECILKLLKYFN